MIFYHFTHPGTVLIIAADGLKPHAETRHGHMTDGVPVVWLTRQPSNLMTADDVADLRLRGQNVEEGDSYFGGKARITVHLDLNNKRLIRYADFLRARGVLDHFRSLLTPTALTEWFVYLGEIPPSKIDATLPAGLMAECLDHHILTHPDPEARERFKAMRAELPDDPFATIELNFK